MPAPTMIRRWNRTARIRHRPDPGQGLGRWLVFAALMWLMALYSVQVAASVHAPHHGQYYQKCQIDRHATAELPAPGPPALPAPQLTCYAPRPHAAARPVAVSFPSRPRSRAPPRHSSDL